MNKLTEKQWSKPDSEKNQYNKPHINITKHYRKNEYNMELHGRGGGGYNKAIVWTPDALNY